MQIFFKNIVFQFSWDFLDMKTLICTHSQICSLFWIKLIQMKQVSRRGMFPFSKITKVLNHSTLTYVQHPLKLWETWCKTRLINYKTILLRKEYLGDFLAWGLEILGLKTCLSYNFVSFSYITYFFCFVWWAFFHSSVHISYCKCMCTCEDPACQQLVCLHWEKQDTVWCWPHLSYLPGWNWNGSFTL